MDISYRHLDYAVRGRVAEITLNRPPVNALNMLVIEELIAALRRAGDDDEVRAVIVTSALDNAFCAGLDLDVVRGRSGLDMRRFLKKLYIELYDVQYALGKPTIAAVRGAARAGGMTVAVSCDMIVAGEGATFGYPEVHVGLVPALHFVHLPRIVGRHRAFELLFGGDSFTAAEAKELGLLNRLVPDDQVLDEARVLATKMAAKSPVVMQLGRDAFMRANDQDYRRAIQNVAETMCALVETEESQEGLAAFVEKRPPAWKDEDPDA
jgi:enoyl-CoA hydratase/carnithine racemase